MAQTKKLSIVDMANAAYAHALPSNPPHSRAAAANANSSSSSDNNMTLDDRLDAARSLLGISPCSVADSNVSSPKAPTFLLGGRLPKPTTTAAMPQQQQRQQQSLWSQEGGETVTGVTFVSAATSNDTNSARPRSNSAGLDALAFLATQQRHQVETITDTSSETETTAPRSRVVSHGLGGSAPAPAPLQPPPGQQLRLVPSQHLLQQVQLPLPMPFVPSAAISSSSDDDSEAMPPPPPRMTTRRRSMSNPEGMEKYDHRQRGRRFQLVLPASILEEELAEASAAMKAKEEEEEDYLHGAEEYHEQQEEADVDEEEELLDQQELLRRARSRLLGDLSQGNLSGDKDVVTLPHTLEKYKEVYNKNGRIGIYTRAERAAIIARFQSKRTRRVWNKKIRYNCRKNLADSRLRVKGRFVKRATLAAAAAAARENTNRVAFSLADETEKEEEEEEHHNQKSDVEMPDVNDPDAGFCPTDDQPYRRTRRHTIT